MTRFYYNKRAFTLIELMVVTALVSVLLGVGSAIFTNSQQKLMLKMSSFQAASILQSARTVSMQENSPSKINILSKENSFQLWTGKVAGCWHLEDETGSGAYNFHAKIQNCLPKEGKIGKSLQFQAGTSKVVLGNYGLFSLDDGFSLCFWIYPERAKENQEQIVWEIPGEYMLGISRDYTLLFRRGKTNLATQEVRLPIYQWSWIEINHEASEISLFLDKTLQFQKQYDNRKNSIPASSPFIIGSLFQGKVDEIKLLRKSLHIDWLLPKELEIRKSPATLFFNSQGLLDPSSHPGGITIVLGKWETAEESIIFLSETGQIRVQY